MYTCEEKIRVLQTYDEIGSMQETIRKLGYPKRKTLYTWLQERNLPAKIKSNATFCCRTKIRNFAPLF